MVQWWGNGRVRLVATGKAPCKHGCVCTDASAGQILGAFDTGSVSGHDVTALKVFSLSL